MTLKELLNKLCASDAFDPQFKESILEVLEKLEDNEIKYIVFDAPPNSGKTFRLALISILIALYKPDFKVVYVAPSYEESTQFIHYLKKVGQLLDGIINRDIRVVVLKGKDKLCIRENNRLRCNGCPYSKVITQNKRGKKRKHHGLIVIDEKEYKSRNLCPFYNLLYQARSANIIVTHLLLLNTLWKSGEVFPEVLPYDPHRAILIIDEAHYVKHILEPEPVKILSLEEEWTFKWINVGNVDLFQLLKSIVHKPSLFNSKEDSEEFKKVYNKLFKTLLDNLNPNKYKEDNKSFLDCLSKYREGIRKVKDVIMNIVNNENIPDPLDFEKIIMNTKLDYKSKYALIDLYWSLYVIKDIKIIRNKYNPSTHEVYIVPFNEPIKPLRGIINEHSKIILSSGTLRKSDIKGIKEIPPPNCPPANVYVANMSANKQDNVLVIVMQDRINIYGLVRRLSNNGYLVYVSHSSYNSADKFVKSLTYRSKLGYVEACIPRTRDELDKCLEKGVKIINIVQNSALSRNHRLIGDVAVVASFISRDIKSYDSQEKLLEHSALDSFQTISRILSPERRVVLVIPKEVYDVVEGKYKKFTRMGVKIEFVRELEDIIEKIRSWNPTPTQIKKKFRTELEKIAKLVKKKKAKGKVYEYAMIEILLPKEHANKRFRIIIEEL